MSRMNSPVTFAALAGLLLATTAACSADAEPVTPAPTVEAQTVVDDEPAATTTPVEAIEQSTADGLVYIDELPEAVAAGVLVPIEAAHNDATLEAGSFYQVSPDGYLWWHDGTHGDYQGEDIPVWLPSTSARIEPVTGKTLDFGTSMYIGKAGRDTGVNGIGTAVVTQDSLVWIAHNATGHGVFDDFDVFTSAVDGSQARKLGENSLDWRDEAYFAQGANSLFVAAGRAYWTEGTNLGPVDGKRRSIIHSTSLFSAPLDGSEAMREEIPGAWGAIADPCAEKGETAFTYLQADNTDPDDGGTVHRRVISADGSIVSDDVVWSSPDPLDFAQQASACGSHLAVEVGPRFRDTPGTYRVEIVGPDGLVTLVAPDGDEPLIVRTIVATKHGVLALTDDNNSAQYYYDFSTKAAYSVGPGSTGAAGYRAKADVLVTSRPGERDDDGIRQYELALYGVPA